MFLPKLERSTSSYGRYVITYRGERTLERKYFWKKSEAQEAYTNMLRELNNA